MKYALISAPFDLSSPQEGAKKAPSILVPLLEKKLSEQKLEFVSYAQLPLPAKKEPVDPKRRRAGEAVQACEGYCRQVEDAISKGFFPIVLGGEHTIAYGSAKASSKGKRQGLIWIDAHGDFNTPETTISGNVHGMVIQMINANALTEFTHLNKPIIAQKDTVLFGSRDVDPLEKVLYDNSQARNFEMKEIRGKGFEKCVKEVEKKFGKLDGVHVSLDLDSIAPELVPGVGLPVEGGFSKKEVEQLLAALAKLRPTCLDVVEYNPSLDNNGVTANLAVDLAMHFVHQLEAQKEVEPVRKPKSV